MQAAGELLYLCATQGLIRSCAERGDLLAEEPQFGKRRSLLRVTHRLRRPRRMKLGKRTACLRPGDT